MYFGHLSAHAWLGRGWLARWYQNVRRLSVRLRFLTGFLHAALLFSYLLLDPLFLVADLCKMRHMDLALGQGSHIRTADVPSTLASDGATSLIRVL